MVYFKDMINTNEFKNNNERLTFALGRDLEGKDVIANIEEMPHVLIAGATGSGKSVCINTLISSIISKEKSEDVKFIMIDPKMVELTVYNNIPHLITPVVNDPIKATGTLAWAIQEMENRYEIFAEKGVKDLKSYNEVAEKLPHIVIVIDEFADLMMTAKKETETIVCRLAQKARAAGMHLVIATQRPSVNVITGLIKANIPTRIAFAVASQVDSRTILDIGGAEKLNGKGDMLFYTQGKLKRVQGTYITDEEVKETVDNAK